MGQGEGTSSASRNFVSVGFMIPSGKLLAWSCCLLTKGVQMRSIACVSSWSSCVPSNRLEFARSARPTRKSEAVFRKDRRYILSSCRLDRSDRNADPRRIDVVDVDVPER